MYVRAGVSRDPTPHRAVLYVAPLHWQLELAFAAISPAQAPRATSPRQGTRAETQTGGLTSTQFGV